MSFRRQGSVQRSPAAAGPVPALAGSPAATGLPVRARLAAGAAVAVARTSRRLHLGGGSVIGGRVGLLLDPSLLEALAAGRRVAVVSGTNGKTTTTRLLAAALGGPGAVATSTAGANLPAGVVAALAGSPAGAPAVLEVDEGYLPALCARSAPAVAVLLNLSRDQLDRVGEVRMVAGRWRAAAAGWDGVAVVANADDPLVVWAASAAPQVVWVAAGQLWHEDATGCPRCEGRITFADDVGGTWACTTCGFRRPDLAAALDGAELVVGERRLPIELALPGRCNLANAAMAAVAAGCLGIDEADALAAMASVREVEGRFATVQVGPSQVRLLLAKNPAGWAELLELLDGGTAPVVVGINARVADGHDPSWLWDVPFERLAGRVVVATGERCRDLAVRLRYGAVAHLTVADQLAALDAARSPEVEYVGNYTAFQQLRRRLRRAGGRGRARSQVPGLGLGASGRVPGSVPGPEPVPGPHRHTAIRQTPVSQPVPSTSTLAVVRVPSDAHASSPATGDGSDDAAGADAGPQQRRSPRRAAAGPSALRVVVVHPELLGTYGDGGNGRVLAARAAWRGLPVELVLAEAGAPLPATGDLYCLGGGEDRPQVQAAELLADGALARAVARGAVVLAVCAGFQVVGLSFPDAEGRPRPGLGLLEVTTERGRGRRAVGEVVVEPALPPPGRGDGAAPPAGAVALERLTGFENHGGVTRLGPGVHPLGHVVRGVGNGTGDGTEGAWAGTVVGTYLHGPVLARNPSLADLLLALATGERLAPLDDVEERALRAERLAAARRHWAGHSTLPQQARALVRWRSAGVTVGGMPWRSRARVRGSPPPGGPRQP